MTGARGRIRAALRRVAPDADQALIDLNVEVLCFPAIDLDSKRTPRQVAQELRKLADAIATLKRASRLSLSAGEHLDRARQEIADRWSVSVANALPMLLDAHYPGIENAARMAADQIAGAPSQPGRRRLAREHDVARHCAAAYRNLTGREPTRIRNLYRDGESEHGSFHEFLTEVCGALGFKTKVDTLAKSVIAERKDGVARIAENSGN